MTAKPQVEEKLQGYDFLWKELGLAISISKVKVHASDGRVTGELLIKTANGKEEIIFPPTQFNFSSDRTRKGLAKNLSEKFEQYPWEILLDQISFAVLERARRGEPVRELWTHEEVPPLEYLIEPILIKGVPTIIFGEKGVGKSTLALVFYLCLILPWWDNPLELGVPTRSIPTLILDYELPGYIAQRNAKKLVEGMKIGSIPLFHRRCFAPLADELEQVANHLVNMKAEVVIIDSLARACGGELNKTEPANAFFEALDKLQITSLILAQTSKDIESKHKTIYGNALFTYYARSIWELCQADSLGDDVLDVALFHRWANLDKRHSDLGFHLSFNGQHTTIERQPVNVEEFKAKVNLQKAILNELKSGKLSLKDIAGKTGRTPAQISPILSKLKRRGAILNLPNDLWGLPAL